MKLFVWKEVLYDFTDGIIFALAEDIDAARKAVIDNHAEWWWLPAWTWDADAEAEIMSWMTDIKPDIYDCTYGFALHGGS